MHFYWDVVWFTNWMPTFREHLICFHFVSLTVVCLSVTPTLRLGTCLTTKPHTLGYDQQSSFVIRLLWYVLLIFLPRLAVKVLFVIWANKQDRPGGGNNPPYSAGVKTFRHSNLWLLVLAPLFPLLVLEGKLGGTFEELLSMFFDVALTCWACCFMTLFVLELEIVKTCFY